MKKNDLIERATDPNLIPGIYNYCDYWCERCPFTARCLNFVSREEDDEPAESRNPANKAFWDKISDNCQLTMEMLRQTAEEHGIDLAALAAEEDDQAEVAQLEEVESHDLAEWSRQYCEASDAWFKEHAKLFKVKAEELVSQAEMGLPGSRPADVAASLHDCVEVIRWYRHQIHVKLLRALMQADQCAGRGDPLSEDLLSDSDGSAKVALIGTDRSIAAWTCLRDHFPQQGDDILDLLLVLGRLRSRTEQDFPNARAFVRPGFDTE